jgi:hypothetical protein
LSKFEYINHSAKFLPTYDNSYWISYVLEICKLHLTIKEFTITQIPTETAEIANITPACYTPIGYISRKDRFLVRKKMAIVIQEFNIIRTVKTIF